MGFLYAVCLPIMAPIRGTPKFGQRPGRWPYLHMSRKSESESRKKIQSARKSKPTGAFDQEWIGQVFVLYFHQASGIQARCNCELCGIEHRGLTCPTKKAAFENAADWALAHSKGCR
jgi:hypothetical protein